jgi:hypothetical protein
VLHSGDLCSVVLSVISMFWALMRYDVVASPVHCNATQAICQTRCQPLTSRWCWKPGGAPHSCTVAQVLYVPIFYGSGTSESQLPAAQQELLSAAASLHNPGG